MEFKVDEAREILSRTPATLSALLDGLSKDWLTVDEGEGTFSIPSVVAHLIHGEQVDWIPRVRIVFSESPLREFMSFDRFGGQAQVELFSITELLVEFTRLRMGNLDELSRLIISEEALGKTGVHPEFGEVTLQQLLAAWVAHDLTHIRQIIRLLARRYRDEVGPWERYMGIYSD